MFYFLSVICGERCDFLYLFPNIIHLKSICELPLRYFGITVVCSKA